MNVSLGRQNGKKIAWWDRPDPVVGWNRLSCGFMPYHAFIAEKKMPDLIRLWCGFIDKTQGVWTIEALYLEAFAHGQGSKADWEVFSQDYFDFGIEAAVRAYFNGVPIEDLVA